MRASDRRPRRASLITSDPRAGWRRLVSPAALVRFDLGADGRGGGVRCLGKSTVAKRGKGEIVAQLGGSDDLLDDCVLLPRVWELRNDLTAYDAGYVALAEALEAPLLTKRLATAAGHHARVELV